MPVHVALLRAVNVGGTTSLAMADLKAICEGLGFADVKTYIQSGNVLSARICRQPKQQQCWTAPFSKSLGRRRA